MTESAKRERSAYSRAYYEANKGAILERQKRYRAEHKEAAAAYHRAWSNRNKDKIKQYNADYWERKSRKHLPQTV